MSRGRKRPRRLVVNASVAMAAGGQDATAAESVACRDALFAIAQSKLVLVFTEALKDEWQAHQSTFSRKWLHDMVGRRRAVEINPAPSGAVRKAMEKHLPVNERPEFEKDLHLLDAALGTDQRIVSLDERLRRRLARLMTFFRKLESFHFANPLWESCLNWLRGNAPNEGKFQLRRSDAHAAGP